MDKITLSDGTVIQTDLRAIIQIGFYRTVYEVYSWHDARGNPGEMAACRECRYRDMHFADETTCSIPPDRIYSECDLWTMSEIVNGIIDWLDESCDIDVDKTYGSKRNAELAIASIIQSL